MERYFIYDALGRIQGNPKGYATMRAAACQFGKHDMQVLLLDIGHARMAEYMKANPTYGGGNLVDIGGYALEDVPDATKR